MPTGFTALERHNHESTDETPTVSQKKIKKDSSPSPKSFALFGTQVRVMSPKFQDSILSPSPSVKKLLYRMSNKFEILNYLTLVDLSTSFFQFPFFL